MVRKSYKQKYEELLRSREVDDKISEHTASYVHIPFSWKSIGRFFALIGSILLVVGYWFVFKATWLALNVSEIFKPEEEMNKALVNVSMLGIIPSVLLAYVLIGLVFICLVAFLRKGFNNLKSFREEGLVWGLTQEFT